MSKQTEILRLIKDYTSYSKYLCILLKDSFDLKGESILRARRLNFIPKDGILADSCYFSFHGGGCYFELENLRIDIDFGPEDRCDGFDSKRLFEFAKSAKKYPTVKSLEDVEKSLEKLAKDELIINPQWYPNPHLFYINPNKAIVV